jgi:hypothetical protein
MVFFYKHIQIPNVAEENIMTLVEEKKTDKLSSPGYNSYHGQLEGWKQITSK